MAGTRDAETPTSTRMKPGKAFKIFHFLRPYTGTFTLGFIFLVLSSLTGLLFPYFLGRLIGEDGATAAPEALLKLDSLGAIITALMVVFTSQAVFSFFRILLFTKVTESALRDIRQKAFAQLVHAPLQFFNQHKTGELSSRIATDINQLQTTFTTTIAEFVRQVITIVVGILALIWLSPKLALIMLSIIPAVAVLAVLFGRYIRKLSKLTQNAAARSNGILEEALQGIQSVKAFTNEGYEMLRYGSSIGEIRHLAIKGSLWRGLFVSFIILCLFGSIVFVIWRGVLLTQEGDLLQSSFISFILYTLFLGASIGSLPDLYAGIQKAVGATEHLVELIEMQGEEVGQSAATRSRGHIRFEQVCFSYPSRPEAQVLQDISFDVRAGEQLAVVGPSGAGKSTLTALLLRFYAPDSGHIFLDGRAVDAYGLQVYRSQFGIVPQEVLLFNGSIRENIAYGRPSAQNEEIEAAAKGANAYDFISSFPDGFDTLVGERGVQLSGGQRQRIAIARAILRDPAVLLLDEATSALDSESEFLVREALTTLMAGRTSIIIAHRLSTIRNANRILVLDAGRVVAYGTHAELMRESNGLYARLQRMQQLEA